MPLLNDFDLQNDHLSTLSSRDQIAGLFARLGYNTNARLTQTAEAMGLTAPNIQREIKHIERIADEEDGVLQVYLCELKTVTVANIQAIARALRNRAGSFLWVLTSDYEHIDFVLFELILSDATTDESTPTISMRGPVRRPRMLTLTRRNPDAVALRVLRRFSYTESDADWQYLKLLSAYGIADWSEPFFNNRALFSDYYLNERLKDLPQWHESTGTAAALQTFRSLMAHARGQLSGKNEAAARDKLFTPALAALGFQITPAATQPTPQDVSASIHHDYILSDPSHPKHALAYCNVYPWDRNLDGPDGTRDVETSNENPGAEVVSLFGEGSASDHAPNWAIVTNGKAWRLYSRRASSRASNYYEIDLEETVNSLDPQLAFRYFWLFFRAAAFRPDAKPATAPAGDATASCFLDRLIDESALYAKQLGERLKDRVFEDIFPQFAEGFIAHMRGRAITDLPLDEVFHGTLTFLYRLLFLLYAESRDLLPAREVRGYDEVSLQKIKREIAQRAGTIDGEQDDKLKHAYSADETTLYDRLTRLFGVIDKGDPALNVPPYNGGLFTTALANKTPGIFGDSGSLDSGILTARFLAENKIPDRYLAMGLDRMARDIDDKTQALAFIDYKSLGVRQLGSIYEGLLEFKVRVAAQKMAVVRGKKADEVVPYKDAVEAGSRIKAELPRGAVYLENDKRERKATGSYYTPDYIVKYIVAHTVGPVLHERFEGLREPLRKAQKGYFDYEKLVKARQSKLKTGKVESPEAFWNSADMKKLAQDVLDVKVLDPAMGSGHFLVEAVDFVSDRLIDFLNAFPHNPVTAALRRSRDAILARMDAQGVSIDPGRLTDVNLLRRQVLKRSVYGVDLNPSAVELAKVSLWLHCFTLGAPLSFLDHHLRCGNSLIGTTAREADQELQATANKKGGVNYTLFGGPFTGLLKSAEIMRGISALGDATLDEVRESAALFNEFEEAALPYKKLLDVFVVRHFGVKGADDFLRLYGADIMNADRGTLNNTNKQMLDERDRLYQQYHFFHWDLEFPEVFIDLENANWKSNEGFDAVVGNPPYVSFGLRGVDSLSAAEKKFLEQTYPHAAEYKISTYALFMECAVRSARNGGYHAFVVPDSFLLGKFFSKIRKYLLSLCDLNRLDLIRHGVWESGDVGSTVIYCVRKNMSGNLLVHSSISSTLTGFETGIYESGTIPQQFFIYSPLQRFRLIINPLKRNLVVRVETLGIRMDQFVKFYSGLIAKGGQDRIRLQDPPINKQFAKLIDSGSGLGRYRLEWDGMFAPLEAHVYHSGYSPDKYLAPKIFLNQTGDHLKACYDPEGYFCLNNIHIGSSVGNTKYSLLSISAILNSSLMDFYYKLTSLEEGRANAQTDIDVIDGLPIRSINFTTPTAHRAELAIQAKRLSISFIGAQLYVSLPTDIITFVSERLAAQPEESDVVHDLLAFLAEQMIDLNKRKQAEYKRFLSWLEDALKIKDDGGIEALTGKSKLRNYLGDYQKGEAELPYQEFEDILFKNRNRLGVSLNEARLTARLRAEYDKSLAVLRPIKDQLARTDALIDQIVYKLYGLTEEEIKVVEGQ